MSIKSDADYRSQTQTIPIIDIILVNIPVLLFIALAGLSAIAALRFKFPVSIAPAVLAWWSLCGAVMLSLDFLKRKRLLYLRLRSGIPPGPKTPLARSLKQTLCGYSVYIAARRYSRTSIRTLPEPGSGLSIHEGREVEYETTV